MWAMLMLWALLRVSISVTPKVVLANGTIRITCTVPRHPDNRWLSIIVPDVTSSNRQLDGEAEKITHVMTVPHIPCGVLVVACDVEDNLERHFTAVTQVTVAGCEE